MVNEQSNRTHEQDNDPVTRAFPALDRMSVGVFAREQSSDRVIADNNSTLPLPPASNTKLITTALALDRLGPDYRFEICAREQTTDTGRSGPVVLWSDRSPVVDVDDFSQLAASMRESGVTSVGDIVLDVSGYTLDEYAPGWMWDDGQHYYGAKLTPIAVAGNTVEVTISTDETTDDSRVSVVPEPDSSIVELSCAVELVDETSGCETDESDENENGNTIEAFRRHGSNQLRITGRVGPTETSHVTLPVGEPLEHAGDVFAQALDRTGIDVDGSLRIQTEPTSLSSNERARNEWSIESPPISEIVRMMNHPSDNFIAEQLALAVVRHEQNRHTGDNPGTWEEWETLIGEFFEARGVNESEYRLRDGSGLSRYNRISAHGLATLVDWAVDQPWGGTFLDSLPVAGRDGTLSDRLRDIDDETTIRAKTGSLTGTRTLTGVIERAEGSTITFSAMVSNLAGAHESRGKEYLDSFVRGLIATTETDPYP